MDAAKNWFDNFRLRCSNVVNTVPRLLLTQDSRFAQLFTNAPSRRDFVQARARSGKHCRMLVSAFRVLLTRQIRRRKSTVEDPYRILRFLFLVATKRLYQRVCSSVGPSVGPSVGDTFAFRPSRRDLWPCIRPCSSSPSPRSFKPELRPQLQAQIAVLSTPFASFTSLSKAHPASYFVPNSL